MYHHVARGDARSIVWRTPVEGRALWDIVWHGVPGIASLVLMPDHLHLDHPLDVRIELARALGAYIRWRAHHRGTPGPGFQRLPPAEWIADQQKRRRSRRYIHLNPCRAHLCDDPLAWAFSTHRDACGLAVPPVIRPRPDAAGFHAYVSGDPHVSVSGTELPALQLGAYPPEDVLVAVSAATRTPMSRMMKRGQGRTLYLAAAAAMATGQKQHAAALVGVHWSRVSRARAPAADLRVVRRVLGDPRFDGLHDVLLPRTSAWARYIRRKRLVLLPGDV